MSGTATKMTALFGYADYLTIPNSVAQSPGVVRSFASWRHSGSSHILCCMGTWRYVVVKVSSTALRFTGVPNTNAVTVPRYLPLSANVREHKLDPFQEGEESGMACSEKHGTTSRVRQTEITLMGEKVDCHSYVGRLLLISATISLNCGPRASNTTLTSGGSGPGSDCS